MQSELISQQAESPQLHPAKGSSVAWWPTRETIYCSGLICPPLTAVSLKWLVKGDEWTSAKQEAWLSTAECHLLRKPEWFLYLSERDTLEPHSVKLLPCELYLCVRTTSEEPSLIQNQWVVKGSLLRGLPLSQLLGVFLQNAAALLFVKENTAKTPDAVKVVTIFKGLLFVQDVHNSTHMASCFWMKQKQPAESLPQCLPNSNHPSPPFFF